MSLNDDTRRSIEIGCHIPELRAEIARLKKELVDGMNALAASQAEIERLRKALERTQGFIRQIFGPKYDKEISDLALTPPVAVSAVPGDAVKITNSALIPDEFWRWDERVPDQVLDLARIEAELNTACAGRCGGSGRITDEETGRSGLCPSCAGTCHRLVPGAELRRK